MSKTADLLALLNDAGRLMRTFDGAYDDWVFPSPTVGLVVDPERPADGVRWSGDGPFGRARLSRRRIRFMDPDRVRVEVMNGTGLLRIGIRDGDRWVRWDRRHGVDDGSAAGNGLTTAPPLLAPPLLWPAGVMAAFRLDATEIATRLDRQVVVARGLPRTSSHGDAESVVEFEFDSHHGTILRRARVENGRCVQLTQATAASYDGPIQRGVFDLRGWLAESGDGGVSRGPPQD